jgi:hypothetical protein
MELRPCTQDGGFKDVGSRLATVEQQMHGPSPSIVSGVLPTGVNATNHGLCSFSCMTAILMEVHLDIDQFAK